MSEPKRPGNWSPTGTPESDPVGGVHGHHPAPAAPNRSTKLELSSARLARVLREQADDRAQAKLMEELDNLFDKWDTKKGASAAGVSSLDDEIIIASQVPSVDLKPWHIG